MNKTRLRWKIGAILDTRSIYMLHLKIQKRVILNF